MVAKARGIGKAARAGLNIEHQHVVHAAADGEGTGDVGAVIAQGECAVADGAAEAGVAVAAILVGLHWAGGEQQPCGGGEGTQSDSPRYPALRSGSGGSGTACETCEHTSRVFHCTFLCYLAGGIKNIL